jgi:CheY-like chemotaxis protein
MPSRSIVLVVDDDADIRQAVKETLVFEGYEVAEARDGEDAFGYLHGHPRPGLILLDWNMTPMNGEQFMTQLQHEPVISTIPVVLLTADMRPEAKFRSRPFVGLLRKPVDLDALFAVVSRYCDQPTPEA